MSINLKKSSLQRVYEYGLKAIRKQGKPARVGSACVYDDGNGNYCIAGHMLTAEQRAEAMESGLTSLHMAPGATFFAELIGPNKRKFVLVRDMQDAHDNCPPHADFLERFETNMREVAHKHGLQYRQPGESIRT